MTYSRGYQPSYHADIVNRSSLCIGFDSAIKNRPVSCGNSEPALTKTNLLWRFDMAAKPLPSPEQLRQLLRYEPETGELFWRERKNPKPSNWNRRFAGKKALNIKDMDGYLRGPILNKGYISHRVIWAMYYGKWPDGQIDHINRDPSDNRIDNLRLLGQTDNNRNRGAFKNNMSGVAGVFWNKRQRHWVAKIGHEGKTIVLGKYKIFEEAMIARRRAERVYGYSEGYGQ